MGQSLSRLHRNTNIPIGGLFGEALRNVPGYSSGATFDILGGGLPRPKKVSDYEQQAGDKVFGVPEDPGAPPDLPPPVVAPVPGQDDLANIRARRRSVRAQLARRGRLSTILSRPDFEPLGG